MGNTVGSQRNLTKRQEEILIGSLLGDTCLEKNGKFARFRMEHSLKQEPYLRWKYSQFRNLVTGLPRLVQSKHKKANKVYVRWHISSYSMPFISQFRRLFYKGRKKVVPVHIAKLLESPLSLAVWFMDDGYKRNDCNALRISTDCFSKNAQKQLQKCLDQNFGIATKLHRKGKVWNIYIPRDEAIKFCEIVKPYILPEMKYKVSLTP